MHETFRETVSATNFGKNVYSDGGTDPAGELRHFISLDPLARFLE